MSTTIVAEAQAPVAPRPPVATVRFGDDTRSASARGDEASPSRVWGILTVAALPVLVFALWWISTSLEWVSPLLLASPAQVWDEFVTRLADGSLLVDVRASLRRVLLGLSLSVLIGTTLGLISGLSSWGHKFLDGTLHMIKAIPFPALIPLLLIWLGIGEGLRIGTLVLAATFSIYLNTVSGIVSIDPRLRELAQTRGVHGVRQLVTIVLPGALPQFLTGLRLAMVISFLALVFAEEIAPQEGLGYILWRASQFSQTDAIILVAVLYAVLGLLISALVTFLERVLLPWRKGFLA